MKSLIILGRQPSLGLAELESLLGANVLTPIKPNAVLLDKPAEDVPFTRLGGSVKLARVLTELNTTDWPRIEEYLGKAIPEHLEYVPEGKFRLGLSAYGLRVRPQDINATGLRLKKIIKATGRSVRIVPNKYSELNSAQIIHNQLTTLSGWELLAYRNGNKTLIAQTFAEQDIEAYAARDQSRPFRDAKVGMLPPKLAQIIINLAKPSSAVLDPFCGTGVVLQEAMLMGFIAYGTDIDRRLVEYSNKNLYWLLTEHRQPLRPTGLLISSTFSVELGDATTHHWQRPLDTVAGETYLGKPLASLPPKPMLDKIRAECESIHEKFLQNIGTQLESGKMLCLAVPAWKTKSGFLHLKTLDHLSDLGYNRVSFVHVKNEDLVYHREGQVVARELVVLEKK